MTAPTPAAVAREVAGVALDLCERARWSVTGGHARWLRAALDRLVRAAQAAQRETDAGVCERALRLADEKLAHYGGEYRGGPHIKQVREAITVALAAIRAAGPPAAEPRRRRARAALAAPPGWVTVAAVRALVEAERWCPLDVTRSVTDNLLARLDALAAPPGAGGTGP